VGDGSQVREAKILLPGADPRLAAPRLGGKYRWIVGEVGGVVDRGLWVRLKISWNVFAGCSSVGSPPISCVGDRGDTYFGDYF